MAKEKIDVVIDNVTYKNIDIYVSPIDGRYVIDTTGVAQIMRQYVKYNFGDIKVWVKSNSYSSGSSVNVYLWNVPQKWYNQVKDFAERFSKYDSGNGWRDRNIGALTTDGKRVDNFSPIMFVNNQPPYDAKENDMTSPNYEEKSTPKKKEYERKGGKFSPTKNLDLILDCGNGWKIYVGKPKEKYLYSCVKDEETKPNREQWAEIKADMLEIGFMWNYGTFQRWTTNPDDTIPQKACSILTKYWEVKGAPKEEQPKESFPFEIGNIVELTHPFSYNNVLYPENYIGQVTSISLEAYVDFGEGYSIPVPFKYLKKFVPKDDKEKESKKEVDLDSYISDLNMLLEMEEDETKRLELATYLSDLNTLKLLQ